MKKWTAVLVGGLLLAGVLTLLPSPAGAELKLSISGQIRFNAIWSDAVYGNDQTIGPGAVPLTGFGSTGLANSQAARARDHSQLLLDARRTRFQFNISDKVGDVKLDGIVQVDFQSNVDTSTRLSEANVPRLRLANATASLPNGFQVRFGQTRTMLSEYGDNLIGGVGMPHDIINDNDRFNQIQARIPALHLAWTTKALGGDVTVGVGAERHAPRDLGSATVIEDRGQAQYPRVVTGIRYRNPLFAVFARYGGANAREVEQRGLVDDKWVWIAAVGGQVTPIPPLTLSAQYGYSDGMWANVGDTVFGDLSLVGVAGAVGRGELWRVTAQGAHGGITYRLTKALRFNAIYQWMESREAPQILTGSDRALTAAALKANTDTQRVDAVNVNFVFDFWTRWETGLEYMYAQRQTFGSQSGTLNAVLYRLWFFF